MDSGAISTKMNPAEQIRATARKMKITKITATRSVKTPQGDFFLAFSSAFDSRQCDYGGHGADAVPEAVEETEVSAQGLSFQEIDLARLLLARAVDLAAWENAYLGGSLQESGFEAKTTEIRKSYNRKIAGLFQGESGHDE